MSARERIKPFQNALAGNHTPLFFGDGRRIDAAVLHERPRIAGRGSFSRQSNRGVDCGVALAVRSGLRFQIIWQSLDRCSQDRSDLFAIGQRPFDDGCVPAQFGGDAPPKLLGR